LSSGRRPQDHFGRRAQREGFAARSIYKLEEIDRRVGLLKAGHYVLDLGAAPGSWTQYAAQRVGPRGRVVAVDLEPAGQGLPNNATFLQRDVFELTPADVGMASADVDANDPHATPAIAGPRFDVLTSDMAPRTSGARHADQFKSFELYMQALAVAAWALKPGGSFVAKIFQGAEFEEARHATRALFGSVRIVKPKASRSESYETFIVGVSRVLVPAAT
jgi:23S rRNA (uridine2552-2'-O)-methyltransferase